MRFQIKKRKQKSDKDIKKKNGFKREHVMRYPTKKPV